MEYLIAVDLEGIHGIVGDAYETLTGSKQYGEAIEAATLEINTAVAALFDCGATRVVVWDNHGGGRNIDFSKVDPRAESADWRSDPRRFDFVDKHNFTAVLLLGYHAREGTIGGVLAHTYSSKKIQYVKLDGRAIGELETDTYILGEHGLPVIFVASDDFATAQIREISPSLTTVITKYGKGRNEAEFKPREVVLDEIDRGIRTALSNGIGPITYDFPAKLEVRYTRMEDADKKLKTLSLPNVTAEYGEDAHILHFTVSCANDIPKCL